jgi:hypothetical protein
VLEGLTEALDGVPDVDVAEVERREAEAHDVGLPIVRQHPERVEVADQLSRPGMAVRDVASAPARLARRKRLEVRIVKLLCHEF